MKTRAVVTALAVAALLAGCGGGSSGGTATPPVTTAPTNPASTSPTATVTAPPSATVTASPSRPAAAAGPCSTGQLALSLGQSQGAAGTFYQAVILTNTSSASCTLFGYPGVSFATASGSQVGLSASRDPGHPHRVRLAASGGTAGALLRQPDPGNFPASKCRPAPAAELKVFPPGQRVALRVSDNQQVCTTSAGRVGVGVMQAGTDPH